MEALKIDMQHNCRTPSGLLANLTPSSDKPCLTPLYFREMGREKCFHNQVTALRGSNRLHVSCNFLNLNGFSAQILTISCAC